MTGQAWLNGGTFAHGAAGPPMVYFSAYIVWLGASDRSWADYSPIYCTAGVDPYATVVTVGFGAGRSSSGRSGVGRYVKICIAATWSHWHHRTGFSEADSRNLR